VTRRRTAIVVVIVLCVVLVAAAVSLLFNTVPLSRGGGGLVQGAADHIHRLIEQRWNLLLYPEGTRSRSGEVGKLRSGAAVLAHEHGIAIVPMHVSGTRAAMPPGRSWPRRAGALRLRRWPVEVRFGTPIHPVCKLRPDKRSLIPTVRGRAERRVLREKPGP